MKYTGYMGKTLHVDLTKGDIKEKELDLSLAMNFIGDWGISCRLAYELIKPGIDPLSPENVIIVGAGPLTGTSCSGASRTHVWTKYPLTNFIGPGGGSMGFSSRLKYAGYDHLVVTGQSNKPVYLRISDDRVEICDAGDLWGKDINEATDKIWKRHGTMNGVICIGQSGENLVKISMAIIDKSGTVGKFGLGAVMGSKKLKAIIASGKKGVRVSDETRFTELTDQMIREEVSWSERERFVDVGHTMYDFDPLARNLGITDYFRISVDPADSKRRFGPEVYMAGFKKARLACPGCTIGCRDICEVKEGEYKGLITYSSHTDCLPGMQLRLKNMAELQRFNGICNRLGIDRLAACTNFQFLIYLNELGIATKDDLEGIEMGNEKSLTKAVEKIAFRQGIGDVLADGREGIIRKFGKDVVEKYGVFIKGGEFWGSIQKSRLGSLRFDLVVNPLGPCNNKGGLVNPGKFDLSATEESFRKFGEGIMIPKENLDRIFDTPMRVNMARLLRHQQDDVAALSSLGFCARIHMAKYYSYKMERMAALYSAATGIEINAQRLKRIGERAWNLYKVLNVREGQSRKDDTFPRAWLEPLQVDGKELRLMDQFATKVLTAEDLEKMLDDYYDERGWEVERGIPTKEKLMELGLGYIVEDLDKQGIILA